MSPQRLSTASYTAAACVARASRSRANKACPRKLEMQKVEMLLCFIAHPWLIHHHWTDSASPPHQTTLEAPKKKWGRKCMHEPAHGVLNLVWYKLKRSSGEVRPHFDLNRIRSKQRLQALDLIWKTVQTSGWEPFKDDCYSEWLSKKVGLYDCAGLRHALNRVDSLCISLHLIASASAKSASASASLLSAWGRQETETGKNPEDVKATADAQQIAASLFGQLWIPKNVQTMKLHDIETNLQSLAQTQFHVLNCTDAFHLQKAITGGMPACACALAAVASVSSLGIEFGKKLRTWLEIIGNGLGNIGNQSLIRCSVKWDSTDCDSLPESASVCYFSLRHLVACAGLTRN
jgi:hypothetical protein